MTLAPDPLLAAAPGRPAGRGAYAARCRPGFAAAGADGRHQGLRAPGLRAGRGDDGPVPAAARVHAQPVRGCAGPPSRRRPPARPAGTGRRLGSRGRSSRPRAAPTPRRVAAATRTRRPIGEAVASALGIDRDAGPPPVHRADRHPASRGQVTAAVARVARPASSGTARRPTALAAAAVALRTTDSATKMATARSMLPGGRWHGTVPVTRDRDRARASA